VKCELCGSFDISLLSHAIIAPWVAKLTSTTRKNSFSSLLECRTCGFRYFSYRYSHAELNQIYSSYRSEQYFQVRNSFEPWFTRSSMNSWDPKSNLKKVNLRRKHLLSFLNECGVHLGSIHNVLDFGGDLGQFFPDEPTGERYLIDPGNTKYRNDGINRIESVEVLNKNCGLIMSSHTLEHIPNLRSTLKGMSSALRQGGFLYIEVPADLFKVSRIHSKNFYNQYLDFLSRIKILFVALDFATGVYRTFSRSIPFWGIVKQSEHINYFQPITLEKLLTSTGLRVLAISKPDYDFAQGLIRTGRISLLAIKD